MYSEYFCLSVHLQIMALEELEIRDLDQVTRIYAELLGCHIRLLKLLLPRVMWKDTPVVMVFEQNTYVNSLEDVKRTVEDSLERSGFKVAFYNRWSNAHNKYMLGKHVSTKIKLEMVHSTVFAIMRETLCYCDPIMSLGWALLTHAIRERGALECKIGASKGAGSSTKMGSNMDVFMYRRSRRGANLPTDITASILDTREAIRLPADRLTDNKHAEQGKLLLGKLREEMSMVTVTETPKGSLVATGGKKSVQGEYTRDDMLSAFLLLAHTKEEICQGDNFVKLSCEMSYR